MNALAHNKHAILLLYWGGVVVALVLVYWAGRGLQELGRWIGRSDVRKARAAERWAVEPDGCQYDLDGYRCGAQVTDIVAGFFYCTVHGEQTRNVIAAVVTAAPRRLA